MSSLTPTRSILDLERRLARLESVISIDASGNVLIHSTGNVKITSARNVDIEAGAVTTVNGRLSMSISAPSVGIRADADASLQCAMLRLSALGVAELKGTPLLLNGGSKPIARSGDSVLVAPGGVGTIQGPGNPMVLG
jgi:hypothetical protein